MEQSSASNEGRLFTVQEAARELGVGDTAIRNATNEGRLPFVHRYGRKLITESALVEYRERTAGQKKRGPSAPAGAQEAA